jgi:hypothetical protein
MFVEILIVTDESVFNDHTKFAKTSDPSLALLNMRIYFTHLINGVNKLFQNSLSNDTNLHITVTHKNFLFLTVIVF